MLRPLWWPPFSTLELAWGYDVYHKARQQEQCEPLFQLADARFVLSMVLLVTLILVVATLIILVSCKLADDKVEWRNRKPIFLDSNAFNTVLYTKGFTFSPSSLRRSQCKCHYWEF